MIHKKRKDGHCKTRSFFSLQLLDALAFLWCSHVNSGLEVINNNAQKTEQRHWTKETQLLLYLCALFREFQWLSHLPVTGRLDSATLVKMTSPRCGVKDARSHSAWGQRVNNIFTGYMDRHEQHLRKKRNIVSGMYTSYTLIVHVYLNLPSFEVFITADVLSFVLC